VKVRPYVVLFSFLTFIVVLCFGQLPKTAGKDACTRCHQLERRTMTGTPHDNMKACEGCHGPGEQHLKSGADVASMFSYRRALAEEVRTRCGQCHHDPVMAKHAEGDVSCTTCHSAHHYVRRKYLLKAEDTEMKPV
jgi:hypothetical protein